jgi:hypothetical protein
MIWRGTPTFESEPALIDELVLAAAARHGARPALIDARSGRRLTFAQLADGARRFAAGLADHGVRRGDAVALVAGNCPDYAVALYGALAAGAAVASANPALTAPELSRQFAVSSTISASGRAARLAAGRQRCVSHEPSRPSTARAARRRTHVPGASCRSRLARDGGDPGDAGGGHVAAHARQEPQLVVALDQHRAAHRPTLSGPPSGSARRSPGQASSAVSRSAPR